MAPICQGAGIPCPLAILIRVLWMLPTETASCEYPKLKLMMDSRGLEIANGTGQGGWLHGQMETQKSMLRLQEKLKDGEA